MWACIYRRFGDPEVLIWRNDWPLPVCGDSQIRVQIEACSVNPKDALLRAGKFGFPLDRRRLPRGVGLDMAGTVIAVGSEVDDFALGDAVFGMTNRFAGGLLAEQAVFEGDELAHRPASIALLEAAASPLAALTALQALRDLCALTAGRRVLIIGASGGVGHCAVQIASLLGAEVDATVSATHHDWITQLGASRVFDHHAQPVSSIAASYDAVFDVSGRYRPQDVSQQLGTKGVFVSTVPSGRMLAAEMAARIRLRRSPRLVIVRSNRADLECLAGWMANGQLSIHLHKVYAADEIAAAHQQIQTSHTAGKLVVTMDST